MAHVRGRTVIRDADTRRHFPKAPSLTALAKECGPVVYALRTRDGLVKFGYTTNIALRASQLGGGLRALLAIQPGTYEDEQSIHQALRHDRHHGREYYNPSPAVLDMVNEMRSEMGCSPIGELPPV